MDRERKKEWASKKKEEEFDDAIGDIDPLKMFHVVHFDFKWIRAIRVYTHNRIKWAIVPVTCIQKVPFELMDLKVWGCVTRIQVK